MDLTGWEAAVERRKGQDGSLITLLSGELCSCKRQEGAISPPSSCRLQTRMSVTSKRTCKPGNKLFQGPLMFTCLHNDTASNMLVSLYVEFCPNARVSLAHTSNALTSLPGRWGMTSAHQDDAGISKHSPPPHTHTHTDQQGRNCSLGAGII